MGLDRTIRFDTEPPAWTVISQQLARIGEVPPLRMIDNLPAFPDETPEAGWKELRVGFAAGMVTLRRGTATLSCVVWGNADAALRASWDQLCWACAIADNGQIATSSGLLTAEQFASEIGLILA